MPTRLPAFLKINDARRQKKELLASLSPFEVELLDVASKSAGYVQGNPKGDHGRISVTPPGRKAECRVIEDGQRILDKLVQTGWLRFAPQCGGPSGYYFPTDSARRLWDVLGR